LIVNHFAATGCTATAGLQSHSRSPLIRGNFHLRFSGAGHKTFKVVQKPLNHWGEPSGGKFESPPFA
jgi:hypothetical protein